MNFRLAGRGKLFKRPSRARENKAPDNACCTECLGFGTKMQSDGIGQGQRQYSTLVCDLCEGRGLRAIPMKELFA